METPQPLRVLGLIFPNFNVLDLTGPAEVFGNSRIAAEQRSLTIASATENTTSSEGITIARQIPFTDLIDGSIALDNYDVLVVPGARPSFIQDALDGDEGLLTILKNFVAISVSEREAHAGEKWLLSVCTGAIFPGAAGLLEGKTVTTHWGSLDFLKEICAKAGSDGADVVRKRFIDAGRGAGGVRLVTAGGVSCGMDAALWVLKEIYGDGKALEVAASMDYRWEFGGDEVKTTEGWIL